MSYSVEDTQDREAMQDLHEALVAVDKKVMAIKSRGFTVKLCQITKEMKDGQQVRVWRPFKDSWNSEVDGTLSAELTKAYRLPYNSKASD